jgi:adenylate kinase
MSVDATRPAKQVGKEILAALELKHPSADHTPARARRTVDLSGLGAGCGRP